MPALEVTFSFQYKPHSTTTQPNGRLIHHGIHTGGFDPRTPRTDPATVHFPPRDLLLAQRVHPAFIACIANSPVLPRRLFRQFPHGYPDRGNIAHPDNYSPDLLHDCGLHYGLEVYGCLGERSGIKFHLQDPYNSCSPCAEVDLLSIATIRPPRDLTSHGAASYLAIHLQQNPVTVKLTIFTTPLTPEDWVLMHSGVMRLSP